MGPVPPALVVLVAFAASAVLLVHLVVTEGRRWDQRHGVRRRGPPRVLPRPPEQPRFQPRVPPRAPPPAVARSAVARPASQAGWTWTGSGWVPAPWGAVRPAPPVLAAAPPRPARSHGCLWAATVSCLLLLGIAGLVVLLVLAVLAGAASLLAGALGA
jgi:hypothetical protein